MIGAMLKRVLLVAAREYKHHARSKGFWLTMVAVPLIAALSGLIPQWVQENKPARAVVVIDQSGGRIAEAIDTAIARDTARRTLIALKSYAADYVPPERVPGLCVASRHYADASRRKCVCQPGSCECGRGVMR